ncbi:hypothetical protein POTOM_054630 [Populus tomentosa]|uniref:Protein kinase domain-containing protein n=1 Tax=Populus tomentosa TaxID=118781 RepID=A0A8X8BYN6_POPTO|nr:hypothetical protein POTOM_054630 [Populus tomentosa]
MDKDYLHRKYVAHAPSPGRFVRLERTQGGGGEGGGDELFPRKRDKMRRWLCCTCQLPVIREAKGREKRICIHVDFDNYDGILKKVEGYPKGSKVAAPVKAELQKEAPPIEVPALSLEELKEKTDNFGSKALIGEGSYGRVYYASLENGKAVAGLYPIICFLYDSILFCTLQFVPFGLLRHLKFFTQVSMVSRLKNENVVELLGYCVEGNLRVLAYEFATMGSLHDILHGRKGVQGAQPGPVLDWIQRVKIAVDAARGLEYLHEKLQPAIIHRDIRSSNVLLFEDFKRRLQILTFQIRLLTWLLAFIQLEF